MWDGGDVQNVGSMDGVFYPMLAMLVVAVLAISLIGFGFMSILNRNLESQENVSNVEYIETE